jgi:hypothetical protein
MKQASIAFALVLLSYCGYAQRSGTNRADRQYLCAKVNQFFNERLKSVVGKNPIEFINENSQFLLGNTFGIELKGKKDMSDEALQAYLTEHGFMLIAGLYIAVLKEFPQFIKVDLKVNSIAKEYTINPQQHTLAFYDERVSKITTVSMEKVVNCNCY